MSKLAATMCACASVSEPPRQPAPPMAHMLWQATITLPGALPGGKRRLLITESEAYRTCEGSEEINGSRVVYLETMEV